MQIYNPTKLEDLKRDVKLMKEIFENREQVKNHQQAIQSRKDKLSGRLTRRQYHGLAAIGVNAYSSDMSKLYDISDLKPSQRLISFDFNSETRSRWSRKAHTLDETWLIDMDDPMVLSTSALSGRAVLWELMLRAASNAKTNLMLMERPVSGLMVGRDEHYRNPTFHLYIPKQMEAMAFAERDAGALQSWALYISAESTGTHGIVVIRKPNVVNVEKCMNDYAAATLAGLKMDDVKRRLNE